MLLTLGLTGFPTNATGGITLTAGQPLMVALTGANAAAGVTLSFGASTNNSGLTATVMPSTDRVVQINAHITNADGSTIPGVMDFLLFDNFADVLPATNYFATLVSGLFYNSAPNDTSKTDGAYGVSSSSATTPACSKPAAPITPIAAAVRHLEGSTITMMPT